MPTVPTPAWRRFEFSGVTDRGTFVRAIGANFARPGTLTPRLEILRLCAANCFFAPFLLPRPPFSCSDDKWGPPDNREGNLTNDTCPKRISLAGRVGTARGHLGFLAS